VHFPLLMSATPNSQKGEAITVLSASESNFT